MTRRLEHRLRKVTRLVEAMPVPRHIVNAAFEQLRDTGELPENQRLATTVVRRVLYGDVPEGDDCALVRHLVRVTVVTEDTGTPLREVLFNEALATHPFMRRAARGALKMAAFQDQDVTAPTFLAGMEPPEFGTVGMRLVGFPERCVRPPYERQADRLWKRYADLRQRIAQADDGWMDRFGDAVLTFRRTFGLPGDELQRDAVLADLEFQGVLDHAAGHDVRQLMELLDRADRAKGRRREAAIEQVVEFVRATPPLEFAAAPPANASSVTSGHRLPAV